MTVEAGGRFGGMVRLFQRKWIELIAFSEEAAISARLTHQLPAERIRFQHAYCRSYVCSLRSRLRLHKLASLDEMI
jgi:hypothetical protein